MTEQETMYTQQNERLEAIQSLMDEILQIQKENRPPDEVMERVQEIIQESSKIVEISEAPHEMILDAKILHTGTQVVSSNLTSFDTNLTTFSETEYVQGLLDFISENSNKQDINLAWDCVTPITFPFFKKTMPLTYLLGTFMLQPLPKKEKKKPERLRKENETNKEVLMTCSQTQEVADEDSDVYEHILKCLVQCFRRNKKTPVNYLKFIIDPSDYWTTVENIFHFSFLVRDDSVKMSFDEKGIPVVEPILKKTTPVKSTSKRNKQFSFRLSKQEWKECIETFGISSASISQFNKSN